MDSFDIEQMFQNPEEVLKAREMLAEVSRRLEESKINYRFSWQMLKDGMFGSELSIPTQDALALVIASSYSDLLRRWNGEDFYLPLMFAVLTVREVTKDD